MVPLSNPLTFTVKVLPSYVRFRRNPDTIEKGFNTFEKSPLEIWNLKVVSVDLPVSRTESWDLAMQRKPPGASGTTKTLQHIILIKTVIYTYLSIYLPIYTSWGGPIELFLVPASAPRLV